MKNLLNRLLVLIYIIFSMSVLMVAIVYPFALAAEDHPPYWTCWILYPVTLVIMATQTKALEWADNVMGLKL